MLNAEFNFPPEKRVPTAEIIALTESLVADLKNSHIADLAGGLKEVSIVANNEKIYLVQDLAGNGLVSSAVAEDFKGALALAYLENQPAWQPEEDTIVAKHS